MSYTAGGNRTVLAYGGEKQQEWPGHKTLDAMAIPLDFRPEFPKNPHTTALPRVSPMGYGLARGRSLVARDVDLGWAGALAALSVYFFSGYFTPVRFDRERIEVRADSPLLSRAVAGREEVS